MHLWNLASQVNRATPTTPELSKDELSTVAACEFHNIINMKAHRLTVRLTGFRLVEAATDIKGPATCEYRTLTITLTTVQLWYAYLGSLQKRWLLYWVGSQEFWSVLHQLPEAGNTPIASQLALQGAEVGHAVLLFTALWQQTVWTIDHFLNYH